MTRHRIAAAAATCVLAAGAALGAVTTAQAGPNYGKVTNYWDSDAQIIVRDVQGYNVTRYPGQSWSTANLVYTPLDAYVVYRGQIVDCLRGGETYSPRSQIGDTFITRWGNLC